MENQIGIGLAEPTASLLSPKQFREFVIPYYVKVMDKWKEWGSHGSGFHICGDTTKLLETFPEMGIRGISIDSAVDIAFAKEIVGDKLSIMGNVSPIEILKVLLNVSNRLLSIASANAGTILVDSRLLLDVIFRLRLLLKISMLICVQQENVQNIRFSHQTGNKG